jgi:hypothetical protein
MNSNIFKISITVLLLTVLFVAVFSNNPSGPGVDSKLSEIQRLESSVADEVVVCDFGTGIMEHEVVENGIEIEWTVRNDSEKPVFLEIGRSSCSCIETSLSLQPTRPGEIAKVNLKFAPFRYPSAYSHFLQVVSKDGRDLTCLIKGTLVPRSWCDGDFYVSDGKETQIELGYYSRVRSSSTETPTIRSTQSTFNPMLVGREAIRFLDTDAVIDRWRILLNSDEDLNRERNNVVWGELEIQQDSHTVLQSFSVSNFELNHAVPRSLVCDCESESEKFEVAIQGPHHLEFDSADGTGGLHVELLEVIRDSNISRLVFSVDGLREMPRDDFGRHGKIALFSMGQKDELEIEVPLFSWGVR